MENKNHKWLENLPDILPDYNENHVHGTIGFPPALVTKKNKQEVHKRTYASHLKFEEPVLEVGDHVRITNWKPTFANKYGARWSIEIFTTSKVHFHDRITYYIQDSDGEEISDGFYKQDLQRTKF